ncbi:MAG: magnesium/cobalt transporter CorA [Candidatus Lokiarchaeota archaeon]|nr:magnesium/cobalt transporter CorA [Candidatus Lokiarchaeota archaeon]
MRRFSRPPRKASNSSKKKKKVGLPPGTLIYTGDKVKEKTKIKVTDYTVDHFNFQEFKDIEIDLTKIEKPLIRWVDIYGLTQVKVIEEVGHQFRLHPLVLEDILSPNQRPKLEDYESYIFVVLKKLSWNQEEDEFEYEQISLILGENYVISFQERDTNLFNPIYERIQVPKGRVRLMGADYLFYVLIDIIIDNYFIVLEKVGEDIENIEDILIKNPVPETLQLIYRLKRSSIELRKSIWPIREVINRLQREQSKLIREELQIYLRDIYDHIFRISDLLENYRDIIFGMLDMYLSSVSNKMNDIMKVLTIISTIFIPLSFLAGFYGMNFLNMPELAQPYSYPILICIMGLIAFIMIYFFKKKRWL